MTGLSSRTVRVQKTSLMHKFICFALSLVLATSLTPSPAFAHENLEETNIAVVTQESPEFSSADEQPVLNSGSDSEADSLTDDKASDAKESQANTVDEVTNSDSTEDDLIGDAVVSSATNATTYSYDAASQMDLFDGFVVIGSQKDYVESNVQGELSSGAVLWANACYEYDDGWDSYNEAISSDSSLSYQWMYASAPEVSPASYQPIPGATNQSLTIDADFTAKYAGAYICVAITGNGTTYYGPTAWNGQDEFLVKNIPGPVVNLNENTIKLKSIVKELNDSFYKLSLEYGVDENVNDVLKADLAERGHEGIGVEVKSVSFRDTNPDAKVGIDSESANNGQVTYFFGDPEKVPYYSMTRLAQADVTFSLSIGDDTYDYTTLVTIPWDETAVKAYLETYADQMSFGFAEGDNLNSITQDFTLPYKVNGKSWSRVTWTSGDESLLKITGYGWNDYAGEVTRLFGDMPITLTAHISFGFSGAPDVALDKEFIGTIKGDPEKVDAGKADLQKRIDTTFVPENIAYVNSDDAVSIKNLNDDIILPTPKDFGLDGKYYEVKYTSTTTSGHSLSINGYRANILAPLPGSDTAQGSLIVTITNKENAEVTATKSIEYAVTPLSRDDIDTELALMTAAKNGYFEAISNGQASDAVTSNMHAFSKATLGEDGQVIWSYSKAEADAAGAGIIPVDFPGYDPMGSALWRLFKSTQPKVVHHENLLVVQDTYNTEVTVQSVLSSEKFSRYADLYPDNADFQALVNQPVSATFTVRGLTGEDNPNPPAPTVPGKVQVTAKVIGVNDQGMPELWADPISVQMDEGATAADLSIKLLDDSGLTYDASGSEYGWLLNTINSPFTGKTYGWDQDTGKFWQLFVNGKSAELGASSIVLDQNDEILWFYSAFEEPAPVPGDMVVNPEAQHPEVDAYWPSFTGQSTNGAVTEAPTPTQNTELKWTYNLKEDGWNRSDTLIIEGDVVVASGSMLKRLDAETGAVKNKATLFTGIDSTSRLLYSQGLILVPLREGRIQCLSADTFETLWVSDKIGPIGGYNQQSLNTMTVDGNKLYFSTGAAGIGETYSGAVGCIDLPTGEILWLNKNEAHAYYWAGGVAVNGFYVIGNDSGSIVAYGENGQTVSSVDVGARVRSSLILDQATSTIYAADYEGVMHKLSIDTKGQLELSASTKFGSKSTSTPALVNGKLIVGGMSVGTESRPWGNGQIAVIDAETMTLEQAVSELAEPDSNGFEVVHGEIQASPLVSVQNGDIYVYFTANYEPGGMFMYRVGDDFITTIFEPEEAQYCISSVVAGADGTLYYTNDSGKLFALKGSGKFLVSFNANGGNNIASIVVDPGTVIEQPATPVRDGYVFDGWFTDKGLNRVYDFASPINSNIVLYAKWLEPIVPNPEGNHPEGNQGSTEQGESSVPSNQGGFVPPSRNPINSFKDESVTKDSEQSFDTKDSEKKDEAISSDKKATTVQNESKQNVVQNNTSNSDTDTSKDTIPSWVYIAGLIIGVTVLGGCIWWFVVGRKRQQ